MSELQSTEWVTIDPFIALEEGKLSLESRIITRIYSPDLRYKIQSIGGGTMAAIILFSIYMWFFTRWNPWFWIAGFTLIFFSFVIGISLELLSRFKVSGTVAFYDKHAVISDNNGMETGRFLYSDLRSITHDEDETVSRNRKSQNHKYLTHIPIRFVLPGKLRYRLELSSELENYTDHKIRLTYAPTLEEVFLWIYPNYERFDKNRKKAKTRFLSN